MGERERGLRRVKQDEKDGEGGGGGGDLLFILTLVER